MTGPDSYSGLEAPLSDRPATRRPEHNHIHTTKCPCFHHSGCGKAASPTIYHASAGAVRLSGSRDARIFNRSEVFRSSLLSALAGDAPSGLVLPLSSLPGGFVLIRPGNRQD